jgi:hypothetical protein
MDKIKSGDEEFSVEEPIESVRGILQVCCRAFELIQEISNTQDLSSLIPATWNQLLLLAFAFYSLGGEVPINEEGLNTSVEFLEIYTSTKINNGCIRDCKIYAECFDIYGLLNKLKSEKP